MLERLCNRQRWWVTYLSKSTCIHTNAKGDLADKCCVVVKGEMLLPLLCLLNASTSSIPIAGFYNVMSCGVG